MKLVQDIRDYLKIEYLLLFLFSFEILDKHHFIIFALFAFLFVKGRIKIVSNSQFALLIAWGISYWIFGHSHLWSEIQVPSLWCVFLIGYSMVNTREDFPIILIIVALGFALEGLLTVYNAEGTQFAVDEDSRFVDSLWGSAKRAISAQNVTMYLFSGCLVYILQKKEIPVLVKVLAVIFELGFLYNSIMIAMRSSLLFNPLIIAISFIAFNGIKFKGKHLFFLLIILSLFVVLYAINFYGIRSFFEDSFLFTRLTEEADGGIAHNSRYNLQGRFWDVYDQDYFGGLHDKIDFYFHNIWLDMYSFSGIISAVLFMFLTISFIKTFINVYKKAEREERSLLAGVFAAFMLPFYMDPMLWAAPCYFAIFIMFYGMLVRKKYIINYNYHLLLMR